MGFLTPELEKSRVEIEKMARDFGLDFFETIFELITFDQMSQFAAKGGFPVRYPHWRFGMDYEQLSKGYEYGLSKIYEMVINTDPCYAYLMEGNMLVDQKLVMAHVFGHCDFFKNNKWFAPTNRKMMDVMANHGTAVRRYMDRYGQDAVEDFIDKCLSIENLIDRYAPYITKSTNQAPATEEEEDPRLKRNEHREGLLRSDKGYMDKYINPPDYVEFLRGKKVDEARQQAKFPSRPERDVMKFIIDFGQLTGWQQDIMSMLREEAYYFVPQGMTKIMNEGWASYWHSTMMTQKILNDSELVCYADHHSGTMAMPPNGFNPYKIGIELFRNIEERWNRGQFGKEWNECDNYEERRRWDKKLGLGRKKIFEVRRDYNDVTFIDEFLTEEFCILNKLFVYKFNKRNNRFEIDTRDFHKIKKQLLFMLTNWGQPIIEVDNGNYENRGELLLKHLHEGVDMQPNYLEATLKNVFTLWGRPANLHTVMDEIETIYRFDGKDFTHKKGSEVFNPESLPTPST